MNCITLLQHEELTLQYISVPILYYSKIGSVLFVNFLHTILKVTFLAAYNRFSIKASKSFFHPFIIMTDITLVPLLAH